MLAWTAAVKLNPNHPTTVSSTEKDPTKVICRKKVVTRPTEAEADLNLKIGKKAPGIVMVVAMPVQPNVFNRNCKLPGNSLFHLFKFRFRGVVVCINK